MSFETPSALDHATAFFNVSCFDLLSIEIVQMAFRLAHEFVASNIIKEQMQSDEGERRDATFRRLETLGYRVGQGLVER